MNARRIIVPPEDFVPRPYQAELMRYMFQGDYGKRKRALAVWPRRSGKEAVSLHVMSVLALERRGFYAYCLPTYSQARRVCWQGFWNDGRPLLDTVFPPGVIQEKREADMILRLANGSIIQFLGGDTIDRLVGTNPFGVVLSELPLYRPNVYDLMRPMLAQNEGWFLGQGTPRGTNFYYRLFQLAQKDAQWFTSHKTVDETHSMPPEAIEEELRSGMNPALLRQELYCDWTAALVGSVWGDLLEGLEKKGALTDFEVPADDVFTSWDLGVDDSTAIWFWRPRQQSEGGGWDFFDYYEAHGKPLSHYFDVLEERTKPPYGYRYAKHWLPHDARARTLVTGSSVLDQCIEEWGGGRVAVVPQLSLLDGVQAGRWLLQRNVRFHMRCAEGFDLLKQYHYAYDEAKKTYSSRPEHDASSHCADSWRYAAVVARMSERLTRREPPKPEKPIAVPVDGAYSLNELWPKGSARRRV